ncbi:MAG: hypothetical protein WBG50_09590 [Desulfomonilaceae bacterium]
MGKVIRIESSRSAKALKQRDSFLDKHPELRPLQHEIDETLRKSGSRHNRLVLIHNLMMDSFLDMNDRLQSVVGDR